MALIDKETICAEIERRRNKWLAESRLIKKGRDVAMYAAGKSSAYAEFLSYLDTLPEQPVEYPTSTEMIAEWENNELPLLRDKDFRGDAERMAYNAFMDGFAKGLGYKK